MEEIKLCKIEHKGSYNSATGDYDSDAIEETTVYAKVSSVSVSKTQIMYGKLDKRAIIIRNPYPISRWVTWNYDFIMFRDRKYTLDNDTAYGFGITSFYFSEV